MITAKLFQELFNTILANLYKPYLPLIKIPKISHHSKTQLQLYCKQKTSSTAELPEIIFFLVSKR